MTIDEIALALFALAFVPWLIPLLESLELPGAFKIKIYNVQNALTKITSGTPSTDIRASGAEVAIFDEDANMALVELRSEIVRRIRELARLHLSWRYV